MATQAAFDAWWGGGGASGKARVPLLKAIEAATAALYERTHLSAVADATLQATMRRVVLESNLAGIDEFGPLW
jgi:hypothetical protein